MSQIGFSVHPLEVTPRDGQDRALGGRGGAQVENPVPGPCVTVPVPCVTSRRALSVPTWDNPRLGGFWGG